MPLPLRLAAARPLALCLLVLLGAAPGASAATLPYPEAVNKARRAAEAVLQRAGRETCLRGKLNRALLQLSASCEASGQSSSPLCSLSDKAVVVTPMSLGFMDATAKQLLDLSAPPPAAPGPLR
ncbi:MAG: hypothetical protein ACKN89_12890 [Cyanobium sp.]